MEGSWSELIRPEQSVLFPTLLRLSREEIVAIWDAVSTYIMDEMIDNKGVLIVGLGTFGTFRELLAIDTGEELVVRRPVFQLDMDAVWLRGLRYRRVTLPVNLEIRQLDLERLSRATSYPRQVVEGCVEETVRLFSLHMRRKEDVAFTFGHVGVLARQRDKVHMRFYAQCTQQLEGTASLIAGLCSKLQMIDLSLPSSPAAPESWPNSVYVFPRFELIVRGSAEGQAFPVLLPQKKGLKEERGGIGSNQELRPGKLLQLLEELSLPKLPNKEEGARRQQRARSKPAAGVLGKQMSPFQGISLLKAPALKFTPHPPAGAPRAAAQIPMLPKRIGVEQRRYRGTAMPARTTQMQVSPPAQQTLQRLASYKVLRHQWKERVEQNRERLKQEEEKHSHSTQLMDLLQSRGQERVGGHRRHQDFDVRK